MAAKEGRMNASSNDDRCPQCWLMYQLAVRLRPISIKDRAEDGVKITSRKYVCSCGCSWERTTREDEVDGPC